MIIKKFHGKTNEDVMQQAQKELGENIVVLAEKVNKPKWYQFFQKSIIEITVAKEEEPQLAASKQNSDIAAAVAEINSLRTSIEAKERAADAGQMPDYLEEKKALTEKLDNIQNLIEEKWEQEKREQMVEAAKTSGASMEAQESGGQARTSASEIEEFIALLQETLLQNEVDRKIVSSLISEVRANIKDDMDLEYIISQIYQKILLKFGKTQCITPSKRKKAKLIYFIGPTGVGKTTTLAKVASQLSILDTKRIALFTADTYRISATDQLETYANILSVPFHIIYSVDEMKTNYEQYQDYDYILVDTAGHSHHNEEQRSLMNDFVHAFDDIAEKEVFLVLSATTKYGDLLSIADTYKEMTEYKLIFTKLDETTAHGSLLNLKMHTGFPLSYVTCGQNVPDDIAEFDPQVTVKRLLSMQK